MTCREATPLLETFVESGQSLDQVLPHLTDCLVCQSRLESLQTLREELSRWPMEVESDVPLAAIRAEVLRKITSRTPWAQRLGWAAVAVASVGFAMAAWNASQRRPMPDLQARLERPAAPSMDFWIPSPNAIPHIPSPAAIEAQPAKPERPPEIRIAALIPPDPETDDAGGMLLELESKNPNVVLYFVADNQGD